MKKKLRFCVLDSETTTLPFVNEIATNSEERKKVSIALPLIYDIGWCIVERDGNIVDKKQFLIAETFGVPSIFRSAYYFEKRPIYINMLKRGDTCVKPWNDVIKILIDDMQKVNAVGAFNSMFDFKKAIPFTELYIKKVYGNNYYEWEEMEKQRAKRIIDGTLNPPERDFNPNIFDFRGVEYPLFDLWGLSVEHLLNNVRYKKECLNHGLLTNSGTFFKSSAESTFQFLCNKYDFVESHTALDDSIIESYILAQIAKKHAITNGIKYFPFRELGYTYDFIQRKKKIERNEVETVYNAILNYIEAKEDKEESNYIKGLKNKLNMLELLLATLS